jgi:hypothetical protein
LSIIVIDTNENICFKCNKSTKVAAWSSQGWKSICDDCLLDLDRQLSDSKENVQIINPDWVINLVPSDKND